MATEALAPCVARSSADMVLTVQNKPVLVFKYICFLIVVNIDKIILFPETIEHMKY